MKSSFMIGAGRFLFRYRSLLFPVIFISILLFFRPHPYGSDIIYHAVIWLGLVIALLGEGVRALTIGLDYIERGGKQGAPFASRLVTRGLYSKVRNPMYVGNLLIALGVGLYSGGPWVLVIILPFFIFVYHAIIAAEENFLRTTFGNEYVDYCKQVNRLIPSFRNLPAAFQGFSFNARRVVEKDNGTAFYIFLGLTLLPLWRMHFLGDVAGRSNYTPWAIGVSIVLFITYVVVRFLAKTGRLAPSQVPA